MWCLRKKFSFKVKSLVAPKKSLHERYNNEVSLYRLQESIHLGRKLFETYGVTFIE